MRAGSRVQPRVVGCNDTQGAMTIGPTLVRVANPALVRITIPPFASPSLPFASPSPLVRITVRAPVHVAVPPHSRHVPALVYVADPGLVPGLVCVVVPALVRIVPPLVPPFIALVLVACLVSSTLSCSSPPCSSCSRRHCHHHRSLSPSPGHSLSPSHSLSSSSSLSPLVVVVHARCPARTHLCLSLVRFRGTGCWNKLG
jgi:hypothetical protein